jgi:hypothetical protein
MYSFDPMTMSYSKVPTLDLSQDVKSLIPTVDGGFLALIELRNELHWFRYTAGKWSDTGETSPLLSVGMLDEWSGGKALVWFKDGKVGDLRRADGRPVINRYTDPVEAVMVGRGTIKSRVVFGDVNGSLITSDGVRRPEVARKPPVFEP